MKSQEIKLIDNVMCALENYRVDIFTSVFGEDVHPSYKTQWLERNASEFWLYMDSQNRGKILDWVKNHYGMES